MANSYLTRFVQATDGSPGSTCCSCFHLLPLLYHGGRGDHLLWSFLPFAGSAVTRADLAAERFAVVIFGLNLTLAALMLYVMIRHAERTPGLAADDTAQKELQSFARERETATLLQAAATVAGVFLPLIAVIFSLAVSVIYSSSRSVR